MLQIVLLQLFHEVVYAVHFFGNVYALRTMRSALSATDAMIRLAKTGDAAVISHEKRPAGLAVVLVQAALGHVSFVYAFIVMQKDAGNVQTVRARHAIIAVVAGYGLVL